MSQPDTLTWISVFLIGLGLNLTPCVYPMLSVTISLFSLSPQQTTIKSFTRALFYVTGIIVTNTLLGTMAAMTGGILGAWLQNRWLLLTIGVALVALSLSMFGFYTLQVPSQLLTRLTGKRHMTLGGFFLSGVLVGFFAAPCIGPPVLGLLAIAATQSDPLYAIRVFFILSLGLGFPYLLLGASTGLMAKLPRSGAWLLWMERLFGVILMSVGAFYLILGIHSAWLKYLLPGSLIAGGIYLGFVERSVAYPKRFDLFRKGVSLAALLVACFILLQPKQSHVVWQPFSFEQLEAAKKANQITVIDFYADWCIPCHELDQFTYSKPEVAKAMASFAKFKVDLTDQETPEAEKLIELYDILGVPTVLFLDPKLGEIKESRISGFMNAKDFVKWLEEKVNSQSASTGQ